MDESEGAMGGAIADLEIGVFRHVRAAARYYGLCPNTITNRLNGVQTRSEANEKNQRLSPLQEQALVDWIIELATRGYPPTHAFAREIASRTLIENNDLKPLGQNWMRGFLRRNPEVSTVVTKKMDAQRAHGTSEDAIREFFVVLRKTLNDFSIPISRMFNMDETGLAMGSGTNHRALAKSGKRRAVKISPETREWVTVIEAVAADGGVLKPLVIFKGVSLQSSWFTSEIPDWAYKCSPNGWTSNEIALIWLEKVFVPATRPTANNRVLLLLDGHGSHCSLDFMILAKRSFVELVFLPPHTSHVLQPLDLAVFAPLKSAYRKILTELAHLDDAAPIKKTRFLTAYNRARINMVETRNIRSGWSAAGIAPFNPERALGSSLRIQSESQRPVTPPQQSEVETGSESVYRTPYTHKQYYLAAAQMYHDHHVSREARMFLRKSAARHSSLAAQLAATKATVAHQKRIIDELKQPTKRRKVTENPNTRFASIQEILTARMASKQLEQEAFGDDDAWYAMEASEDVATAGLTGCLYEWQITR